ncbi:hypothetical protein F971_00805 [Acinetobacter vivianii]|uniref:Uncharacterized protein n=1 Tax=Acinetobacter vivianii TaxID=1776742 RepID=N8WE82_9GAMM|nr:hypothetical protein [Acinetobacter vivianii]ENU93547.1 hypothetical protein F971_00805 [Acinetobacter vivianii]
MKIILKTMTDNELKEHEQKLLAQWTRRIALEVQIDNFSSQRTELLEIYNNLKPPHSSKNERLINSIMTLKYKLEDLEDELNDIIQDSYI